MEKKTKININKDRLEDTFLRAIDSIKNGELSNFEIIRNDLRYLCIKNETYSIKIPETKEGYKIKFRIMKPVHSYEGGYFIWVSVDDFSEHISSKSKEVKDAFNYIRKEFLKHEDKCDEEKSLEELLFNEE